MKKFFIIFFFFLASAAIHFSFLPVDTIKTKAALGKKLFNEKILSKDSSISCASCHIPEFGFADTVALSKGIFGRLTKRNTPSVLNMKNRPYFFWDARAETLEQQALMPIANPDEMGLPIKEAVARLNAHPVYKKLFLQVFGTVPNAKNLSAAFAAFEKTLETGESKFDLSVDDKVQLTVSEERGRNLFISDKTHCFDCHRGEDFTNDDFKNIGLFDGHELNDKGRFNQTKDSLDLGKFKTPGLRNIAITAPYMHDGRFATLEQVVEYYNSPTHFISNPINIDKTLAVPLRLSPQNKNDLIAFLKTLTDKRYVK
ncbi:MAG: c-type cytochrome [Chitinophagaceae bacterium]|nr:c-type cytochrome [Chitinophagaceae bacterium]